MLIRRFYFFRQNCQRYAALFRFLALRLIQPAGLTAHGPDGIIESLINIFGGCPMKKLTLPRLASAVLGALFFLAACIVLAVRLVRGEAGLTAAAALVLTACGGAALTVRARPAAQPVGAAGGGRRVPCVPWSCAADPLRADVDGAAGHALCPRPRRRGHG